MIKLTASDIRQRSNNLRIISDTPVNTGIKSLYDRVMENYSFNNAKLILENWKGLSKDETVAFEKVLDVFDAICENDNVSHIKTAQLIIERKVLQHIVRNGEQLRHLNNHKLGKVKIPNTKINKNAHLNATVTVRDLQNKGKHVNTLHPHRKYKYDMFNNKIGKEKSNNNNSDEGSENKSPQDQAMEEAYDCFINDIWKNQQCDRVLENHEKLSKRFNFDKIVRECPRDEDGYYDCIIELCKLIDSYDIAYGAKYGIALENIMYFMNKNCVPVPNSLITEAVTDYFLLSYETDDDMIHDMKYIIEENKFFNEDDFEPVEYLFENEQEFQEITTTEEAMDALLEFNKVPHKRYKDENGKRIKPTTQKFEIKGNKTEKDTVKDTIRRFKMSNDKSIQGLKKCIYRVFQNSPENIVKGLPDVFAILRGVVLLGMFAIGPFIGLFGMIVGAFLKMDISRKQMREVIAQYDKEIARYQKKVNTTKDEKLKKKYQEVLKKLKKDREALDNREDQLYTDTENEKRSDERFSKRLKDEDDGSFEKDFDFDFNFDEMAKYIGDNSVLLESMSWSTRELMNTIRNSIEKIDDDNITILSEAVFACDEVFDIDQYKTILEQERTRLRQLDGLSKYRKIDAISLAINEASKYKPKIDEDIGDKNFDLIPTFEHTKLVRDTVDDVLEFLEASRNSSNEGIINEGIGTKVKLAADKLHRTAIKVKDKDHQVSENIDVTMGHFAQAAERALTNNRREAVIKGSLLPTASKCIKAALVTGAAWMVSPVIAVIGTLGAVAMSKHLQKKERQLILDDIDIELKMCEKYLRLAEDKNDMKAVRNIMQTQRALERQRQRLVYNMKTKWNEDIKTPSNPHKNEGVDFEEKYIGLLGIKIIEE